MYVFHKILLIYLTLNTYVVVHLHNYVQVYN